MVKNIETHKILAIKKQSKIHEKSKRTDQNVMDEFKMMKNIKSSFIPEQIETFQDDQAYYFVMELLQEDMYKYMQQFYQSSKAPMDKKQNDNFKKCFKFLIANIIQALEDIHDNKIIHKDIKPQNIMFDKDNYLKIIDFGISQDLKEKVQYRQDGGTLGYMAPEVITKKNYRY